MARPSEGTYPNIARWVYEHEGQIEIGWDFSGPFTSFIKATDRGGTLWEGKDCYDTLEDAFKDLEASLAQTLKDIYRE